MPSIDGGSSTSIEYAPHMYVLREGGDYQVDEDYIFVGNATAYYDDKEDAPSITFDEEGKIRNQEYKEYVARIASLPTKTLVYSHYHIGVATTEGLVGDISTKELRAVESDGRNYLFDDFVEGTHKGIPTIEIPEAAKIELTKAGLREISTLSGHLILGALNIEVPTDIEPLNFAKLFNGTPAEQAAEKRKSEQWKNIANTLRQTLGIE